MQEFFLKVFIQIFYALIKHSGAKFSTLISSRMKKMPFYLLLESRERSKIDTKIEITNTIFSKRTVTIY